LKKISDCRFKFTGLLLEILEKDKFWASLEKNLSEQSIYCLPSRLGKINFFVSAISKKEQSLISAHS
jgi:hypothetical protein